MSTAGELDRGELRRELGVEVAAAKSVDSSTRCTNCRRRRRPASIPAARAPFVLELVAGAREGIGVPWSLVADQRLSARWPPRSWLPAVMSV